MAKDWTNCWESLPDTGKYANITTTTQIGAVGANLGGGREAPPLVVVFAYLPVSGRLSQQFVQSFAMPFTVYGLLYLPLLVFRNATGLLVLV